MNNEFDSERAPRSFSTMTATCFSPAIANVLFANCSEPEGTYPLGGTNWSTVPSSSQSTP